MSSMYDEFERERRQKTMQCPVCNTFLDDDTIFCGNCGRQVRPQQARGDTIAIPLNRSAYGKSAGAIQTIIGNRTPDPRTQPSLNSSIPPTQEQLPRHPSPLLPPRRSFKQLKTILVALLVLSLAGATAFILASVRNSGTPIAQAANASGQVVFFDSAAGFGNTDALKISLTGLQLPPAGSEYDAWLINSQTEQVNALGTLKRTGTTFSLNFTSSSPNGQPGTNLLNLGDQVTITQEHGQVSLPSGPTLLAATFPSKAFLHIKHLLSRFPSTPGGVGLLVGLSGQTRLLNAQAQVLQQISKDQNFLGQKCLAQSLLDIIEGQTGSDFRLLPTSCDATTAIGDGFGILGIGGYASLAAQHAALAASQPDTTAVIRQHASEVEIATTNITNWVNTLQSDALQVLNGQADKATIDEIATLAEKVNFGFDTNGNGQVDPSPGEAGAVTAYHSAQQMATLSLIVPSNT